MVQFKVSHLLLADDALLFCGADINHIKSLKALLLCFESVFGFNVNFDKSELVPVNNVGNIRRMANLLIYKASSLPLIYLGLPLGSLSRSVAI